MDEYSFATDESYVTFCAKKTAFFAHYVSQTNSIEVNYSLYVESEGWPAVIVDYKTTSRLIKLIYEYTDEYYDSIATPLNNRDKIETYGACLETIVYNQLVADGYEVYIGKTKDYEVDFIAHKQKNIHTSCLFPNQ